MSDQEIEWLDALLDLEEGLTDWEVDFIESLSKRKDRDLTDRQHGCLRQLYEKHF